MATTSSDENVSITISKETIKSVKMLALVIIVGIIVVAGGLFLKERVLDPAATATTTAVTDVLRGKSYETLDEAVLAVEERYASKHPRDDVSVIAVNEDQYLSFYSIAKPEEVIAERDRISGLDAQYFVIKTYSGDTWDVGYRVLGFAVVTQQGDERWYPKLDDVSIK